VTTADGPPIRPGRPEEFGRLRQIELASDELYATVGFGPFANDDAENHLDGAAAVLVAGDPPVGFALVEVLDGEALLWQLSVLPSAGRRGIGGALLAAVDDWAAGAGFTSVVLTTFRDVPFNAPFYARHGFEIVDDLSPGLAAVRAHERAIGDDALGPRVAMRKRL